MTQLAASRLTRGTTDHRQFYISRQHKIDLCFGRKLQFLSLREQYCCRSGSAADDRSYRRAFPTTGNCANSRTQCCATCDFRRVTFMVVAGDSDKRFGRDAEHLAGDIHFVENQFQTCASFDTPWFIDLHEMTHYSISLVGHNLPIHDDRLAET